MRYYHYSVEDFLADEFFQQWVLHPDEESDHFWQNWLTKHPEKQADVEQARQLLLRMKQDDTAAFSERQIGRIWERIEAGRSETTDRMEPMEQTAPRLGFRRYWRVAAAITALVVAFSAYFLLGYTSRTTYETAFGETQSITLPDGSQVTLNANSSLAFSGDWSTEKEREVWLKGEAYFTVTRKPGPVNARNGYAKFIVHTDDLNVEVLGTRFNLFARQGKTQVVLEEGKVQVTDLRTGARQKLLMKPGELVEVVQQVPPVTKKAVKTAVYSSWKDNELVFDETPLREVARVLEVNYGYRVKFSDASMPDRKFNGTFPADNLSALFEALALSFHITISQKENELLFSPKR